MQVKDTTPFRVCVVHFGLLTSSVKLYNNYLTNYLWGNNDDTAPERLE